MSAWYIFGALGFYPVNPVSGDYVIGSYVLFHFPLATSCVTEIFASPFFDSITIRLPNAARPLKVTSNGAASKPYVKSLIVDGQPTKEPVITHQQIANGGDILFDMSEQAEAWASSTIAK